MVTLIREGYFEKNILPLLKTSPRELTEAHSLFKLSTANNSAMLVSRYSEADIKLLGFSVPHVGFLIVKDPNTLLEPQCSTQLPGVIGCNLIHLVCEEFGRVYGFKLFKNFKVCKVYIPWFLCIFVHFTIKKSFGFKLSLPAKVSLTLVLQGLAPKLKKKKKKDINSDLDITLGQVWVSDSHQPICILANSAKVFSGKTNKITKCLMCMVKARSNNNLPMGVVVNRTIVTPTKSKHVLVILMNTNSYNVWIHQSLLAADIVEADHCPWDYQSFLSHEGDKVKVTFHPVPSSEVQEEILSSAIDNSQLDSDSTEQGERCMFGP